MTIMPNNHLWAKRLFVLALLAIIGGSAFYIYKNREVVQPELPPAEVTYTAPRNPTQPRRSDIEIPKSLQIAVPFTSQAPTANWDELHNEACEEASAIMANAYFKQINSLAPTYVEGEISKLTKWEDDEFGYHLSINTTETVKMIEEVYGLEAETVEMSEVVVKRALFENKLVIIPANGQMLDNPNFRAPGPVYHMLVVTGYNGSTMVTNDPGTRKGEDYQYSYQTLYKAAGNYMHSTHQVDLNDKQIIIVSNE